MGNKWGVDDRERMEDVVLTAKMMEISPQHPSRVLEGRCQRNRLQSSGNKQKSFEHTHYALWSAPSFIASACMVTVNEADIKVLPYWATDP